MKKIILLIGIVFAIQSCKKCGTCYYESTSTQQSAPYKEEKKEFSEDACDDEYKAMKKDKDVYYNDGRVTVDGQPANLHIHLKYCDNK